MFFFFNDTATTEIYTLSLHDALPISVAPTVRPPRRRRRRRARPRAHPDRKSTRLNSSHSQISYAVFCLKKKIEVYSREHSVHQKIPRRGPERQDRRGARRSEA